LHETQDKAKDIESARKGIEFLNLQRRIKND